METLPPQQGPASENTAGAARPVIGMYGKLPGHGDFVHRNLSTQVLTAWDNWLQAFIGSSQERMGDAWLDIYLTSPIWRFALSEGVLDQNKWAGILLPSVDRVGRYFPFTMLVPVPQGVPLSQFLATQESWFVSLEQNALEALGNHINVDELLHAVENMQLQNTSTHLQQAGVNISAGVVACAEQNGSAIQGAMPLMLESFLSTSFASYSIWATQGSERVAPGMLTCHGLPAVGGSSAMLDGDWVNWQWSEPFAWVAE